MQKIAYSTLAIAAPVVLQGCSEEDEQTTAPPVDCSTLSETECKANDNAQCNWDQLESVPENCSAPEDFRDTLASFNDDPEGCVEHGGVRVQPCKKVKECSDFDLAEINSIFDDQGLNRPNGKITFTEAYDALGESTLERVIEVRFSNADTGTFNIVGADAANPDNLCTGYLHATLNGVSLAISPAADPTDPEVQSFNCGAADLLTGSFAALNYAGVVVPIANDFGNNKIYDAAFYDACSDDTMCGMNMDGTCAPIEDFCAQFDAFTCPTTYEKDNVGFVQGLVDGVEAEVIANSEVCQFQHAIGDDIMDEVTGEPTGELYLENIGCQTLDGLELVTCGASPFPSFGEFDAPNPQDPTDPTLNEVEGEDMCSLWLADAEDWEGDNQSARAIYVCATAGEFAQLNASSGEVECIDANGDPNQNGPPQLATRGLANGRACQIVGEANESNFVKECALPREFSCGEPLDGADADEECIKTNICVYDNGDRFECAESDASVSGSGGRVGDDDAVDDNDEGSQQDE